MKTWFNFCTAALVAALLAAVVPATRAAPVAFVNMDPADSLTGYIARLLINEAPFPGERGYVSEEDTQATMLAILWVLHSRIDHIPAGYRQEQVASVKTGHILDIITAGGEKGQCDGFYRDQSGKPVAVPRVHERLAYLTKIANSGGAPGKFARLLNYGQGLARAYVASGIEGADRFANLRAVGKYTVTGRAYSWMTDRDYYHPGGNFVSIPDQQQGSLGGNRFFTLRKLK